MAGKRSANPRRVKSAGSPAPQSPRELSCMIRVDGAEYCIDPAGGIADALGKKWTLPLIGLLGNRTRTRFHELRDGLEGVGSKALSDRLKQLQQLGLVARDAYAEVPTRVEYRLTDRGLTLRRALVPLLEWAATQGRELGELRGN